jgi:hypothetical protein
VIKLSFMGYEALVFLPPACNGNLDLAEAMLRRRLPAMMLTRTSSGITLSDGWRIGIGLSDEPHVIVESKWLIDRCGADRADADQLRAASRRFEVRTDDDPNMDRFNDYVYVLEVLTSFLGAVAFKPGSGTFV